MQPINPYTMPTKTKGTSKHSYTHKYDPDYGQALVELAASESRIYGRKISVPTLITNLTTRNAKYFVIRRSGLDKRWKQIKKENQLNARRINDISPR